MNKGEIVIYQDESGQSKLEVKLDENTVWLTQAQMAELFQTTPQNITQHVKNIYSEKELVENTTCKEYLQVVNRGFRGAVEDKLLYYNLDMIIAVGYRVRSNVGTAFRRWATAILHEYIQKGFAMDDERLKGNGGGDYWKELLDRIRDIRSSEKLLYRQVLDLYATAVDYDPKAQESIEFFKIVQNKLHYAAHGHTASEVIYERVDADKPFMGLKSFKGPLPTKQEAQIAKNFLDEKELKVLNNLVSGYFDFAEVYAQQHKHLYMKDYIRQLDAILTANGQQLLEGAGKISHQKAMNKVDAEYKKYQQITITPVEQAYLDSLKTLEAKVKKKK